AEQGNAQAQVDLGMMYNFGQGVAWDPVKAHMWYNIAAANGISAAPSFRDVLEKSMLKRDISEAQRRARVCLASNYQDCE
ncbi:MAG: sel1 repeat family protein, partial [Proteobacteria bacterium]|nr:sel1 repeat family protein [Pseudomonadota bacterium]